MAEIVRALEAMVAQQLVYWALRLYIAAGERSLALSLKETLKLGASRPPRRRGDG
jgi:hypothetical protein